MSKDIIDPPVPIKHKKSKKDKEKLFNETDQANSSHKKDNRKKHKVVGVLPIYMSHTLD
jgi:hypothetical protein